MILSPNEISTPINFKDLFGQESPVEIEIGVGKGRFLRERATALPDHFFIGIEKSKKWLEHAAVRLEKAGVKNVRLVQCYVEGFLERYVPDGSITAYHIYYPDPWPKSRHHKRRLFTPPFIREMHRTLKPQGEIHIATDHLEYFNVIREAFSPYSPRLLNFQETSTTTPFQSNYQVKYEREGRPMAYAVARRCEDTEMRSAEL